MEKQFEVLNVKCGGCANTLRQALENDFGEVKVDLRTTPRQISLEIDDSKINILREKLISIGYPLVDEDLETIEKIKVKAKSFVSCAIGRINK